MQRKKSYYLSSMAHKFHSNLMEPAFFVSPFLGPRESGLRINLWCDVYVLSVIKVIVIFYVLVIRDIVFCLLKKPHNFSRQFHHDTTRYLCKAISVRVSTLNISHEIIFTFTRPNILIILKNVFFNKIVLTMLFDIFGWKNLT